MVKKRKNVGLYISEDNGDIADWINALKRDNESPAKWISGLLVAEKTGKTPLRLSISKTATCPTPTKTVANPLNPGNKPAISMFGTGSSINQKSVLQNDTSTKWKYGWQVKNENGEFTTGSVINLSFCRYEIVDILTELNKLGIKLATYIKALIAKSLHEQDSCPLLTKDKLDAMLRDYYLEVAQVQISSTPA